MAWGHFGCSEEHPRAPVWPETAGRPSAQSILLFPAACSSRRVLGGRAASRPANHPRTPHDGTRTHAEARVALPNAEQEEDGVRSRGFSLQEITSGLPDDSREADERAAERGLREVRFRVKVARAVVATTRGMAEMLARDWRKASRFYARFGITKAQFRHGVPSDTVETTAGAMEGLTSLIDWTSEIRARGAHYARVLGVGRVGPAPAWSTPWGRAAHPPGRPRGAATRRVT
jgi:hypothetical protein